MVLVFLYWDCMFLLCLLGMLSGGCFCSIISQISLFEWFSDLEAFRRTYAEVILTNHSVSNYRFSWKYAKITIFMIFGWSQKVAPIFEHHFLTKSSKSVFFEILAQKASKVIISLFSGFWESSTKMRGSFLSRGGTQGWPGTAIVNHPLRQ